MYIVDTGFGYAVFYKGKLIIECTTYEEAKEYMNERSVKSSY